MKKVMKINISKYINKGHNTVTFKTPVEFMHGKDKYIKLYVELVEKDDNKYSW